MPAVVLFSGLAPLTVGYYQVDLELPAALAPGNHDVRCFLPAIDLQRLTGAVPASGGCSDHFGQANRIAVRRHPTRPSVTDIVDLSAEASTGPDLPIRLRWLHSLMSRMSSTATRIGTSRLTSKTPGMRCPSVTRS